MSAILPFLTTYDPPGTSEGALDPLGLYQIADHLAVQLVPAVRERMQRIRMLTAMAVGAMVTESIDDDPRNRDASPYLVWEWLVVEALTRRMRADSGLWGVPGTLVAARAIDQQGYLDARSYLKTPRIFGFTGVYKRLAIHLGVTDVHLGAGPNAEALVNAWSRGLNSAGLPDARRLLARWTAAVKRSLSESPPRKGRLLPISHRIFLTSFPIIGSIMSCATGECTASTILEHRRTEDWEVDRLRSLAILLSEVLQHNSNHLGPRHTSKNELA